MQSGLKSLISLKQVLFKIVFFMHKKLMDAINSDVKQVVLFFSLLFKTLCAEMAFQFVYIRKGIKM